MAKTKKMNRKVRKPSKQDFVLSRNSKLSGSSIPVTIGVTSSSVPMVLSKAQFHRDFGNDGIRISGRSTYMPVTTVAGQSYPFGSGGDPQLTTYYTLGLSPTMFSSASRLESMGAQWSRYAFRKVVFNYVPYCPSTMTGGLSLAYSTDGGYSYEPTPTFTSLSAFESAVTGPLYAPMSMTITYTGDQTWITDFPTTTQIAARQCLQGTVIGRLSGDAVASDSVGMIYVDYVLDLYSPTAKVSTLSLARLLPSQREEIKASYQRMIESQKGSTPKLNNIPATTCFVPNRPLISEQGATITEDVKLEANGVANPLWVSISPTSNTNVPKVEVPPKVKEGRVDDEMVLIRRSDLK